MYIYKVHMTSNAADLCDGIFPVAPVGYQVTLRLSSSLVQVSFVSSSPAKCILVCICWDYFLFIN